MLGEVMYGGRVTDDFDKRLLVTFTSVWFNESLLSSSFEFHKGYRVPMSRNLSTYTDYITSMSQSDTPEVSFSVSFVCYIRKMYKLKKTKFNN